MCSSGSGIWLMLLLVLLLKDSLDLERLPICEDEEEFCCLNAACWLSQPTGKYIVPIFFKKKIRKYMYQGLLGFEK